MIHRLLRALGFRSLYRQLREVRLLRLTVVGDRIEIAYTGRRRLPKRYVLDLYGAVEAWGLRTCSYRKRAPTNRERRQRRRAAEGHGQSVETATQAENQPAYDFFLPIVLMRNSQPNPAAYNLLAAQIGEGIDVNLSELAELAKAVIFDTLSPEEALRLGYENR